MAPADPATATAVDAAKAASWPGRHAVARRARVFKFRELLEDNLKAFAALFIVEHGKKSDAEGSIIRGLEVVEFAAATSPARAVHRTGWPRHHAVDPPALGRC